jgi:hypothetical protein
MMAAEHDDSDNPEADMTLLKRSSRKKMRSNVILDDEEEELNNSLRGPNGDTSEVSCPCEHTFNIADMFMFVGIPNEQDEENARESNDPSDFNYSLHNQEGMRGDTSSGQGDGNLSTSVSNNVILVFHFSFHFSFCSGTHLTHLFTDTYWGG